MKKFIKYFLIFAGIATIAYFLGPKPKSANYNYTLAPTSNISLTQLAANIAATEATFALKPNNQAQIIFADSVPQKTKYCILYLHGFSASQTEGDPIHKNIAKAFGCNLYLARLYGHGLADTLHTFEDLTAENYFNSAKQAFEVATQLGQQVIIISTSTGGTLSLQLAAQYGSKIKAQILLSPNIEIFDNTAKILNNPWGAQIAKLVKGTDTLYSQRQDTTYQKYWNHRYSLKGAIALEELIETTMLPKTFKNITTPTCLLYYYKNQTEQDKVVKVSAMQTMFTQLATPANLKEQHAIPNAGNHVIGSYVISNDVPTVEAKIKAFLQKIL
jgi:esterase/lipase